MHVLLTVFTGMDWGSCSVLVCCQRAGLALQDGKRFKVVAADARPHLEGRVLRQRLIKHGIACTYILLNAVACVIPVSSAWHLLHNTHIVT